MRIFVTDFGVAKRLLCRFGGKSEQRVTESVLRRTGHWASCVVALDEAMLIATPVRREWVSFLVKVRTRCVDTPFGPKKQSKTRVQLELESSSAVSRLFWTNLIG